MNAQIKQLIRQATGPVIVRKWDDENHCHYNETEFKLDVEKFAELIVRECYDIAYDGDGILEHFGLRK